MNSQSKQQDPGAVLREAREAAGLTTQDVADSLNLLICNVEAIEANNYSKMHGDLFVRGYVKAYARHLDLDVDALVADVDQLLEVQNSAIRKRDTVRNTGCWKKGFKPAHKAALVIFLAGLIWVIANHYLGGSHESTEPAPVDAAHEE